MIFTNGQRSLHISPQTLTRVRDTLTRRPGLTVPEYSVLTEVASARINILIAADETLWRLASEGKIAVSPVGNKPDWFFELAQPDLVPIRMSVRQTQAKIAHGIRHGLVAREVDDLVQMTDVIGYQLSPRRRRSAKEEIIRRVIDMGLQAEEAMVAFDRLAVKLGRGGKRSKIMTQQARVSV